MPNRPASHLRVLVIDDEADTADSLARVLALHGFTASIATSGADALLILESDPPDVVVTDLLMPGVDGFEIARRVRSLVPRRPLLVAVTGAARETLDAAEESGFDLVLMKPADPILIVGVLRRFERLFAIAG
ncbi:histidine kinase : Chemotaxis protein methyltransferase CheR OS=Polaromonas sp. CG9_12 PE=4 SV=1: Response_reg [Gemmata massiliana]|uniref:Response regulatory domain-containing protein n=1 Tax=Gemmata massiliana TaxID=1210884 RepID=A0A6P2CSU9_9BACT|nr:response regulator [Gemmata massiliana]VTR91983.1 histidine kinase : Chemotaxis protein methyltransferase CheR OS=Polaromonas sp. CG9_12 PE=4 SV=1: Response_reg [Gemmata massiliana]